MKTIVKLFILFVVILLVIAGFYYSIDSLFNFLSSLNINSLPVFFGKGEFTLGPTPKFYGKEDYNSCTPKPTNFTTDVVIPQELANKIETGKEYIVVISGLNNEVVKVTANESEAYSWSNYTVNGCEKECGEFNISANFNASKLIVTAYFNSKKDANFSVSMDFGGPCRRMTSEEINNLEKNGTLFIRTGDLGVCPTTCSPYSYNSSINLRVGESKRFDFVSNCKESDYGTYLLLSNFECKYIENNITHLGGEGPNEIIIYKPST